MYIYIYIRHTFNCVGVVSVVSSPYYEPCSTGLTTRRSQHDRVQESKWSRPGPTRRRSTCKKDRAGAVRCKRDRARERKWKQRDGTLHQKRVRQRRKSDRLRKKRCIQGESRVTLHLLTLQTTALPSSPLLTCGYLLAYFRISFCARHTLHMRIPSINRNCIVQSSGRVIK